MNKIVMFVAAMLLTVSAYAGTLVPGSSPNLWNVDGNPGLVLLLEPTSIASAIAGNGTITQVTGAYGDYSSQMVWPVYGSCIEVPAGWNNGEVRQCTIHGVSDDATIIFFDVNGIGQWDYEL